MRYILRKMIHYYVLLLVRLIKIVQKSEPVYHKTGTEPVPVAEELFLYIFLVNVIVTEEGF